MVYFVDSGVQGSPAPFAFVVGHPFAGLAFINFFFRAASNLA